MKINENYKNLSESYLFSTIAKKVAVYTQQHPEQEIIRLGIGDVTLPLAAPVVDALHAAVEERGKKETFHGYGPEQGLRLFEAGSDALLRPGAALCWRRTRSLWATVRKATSGISWTCSM